MQNHYTFIGGGSGAWRVTRCDAVIGEPLPAVDCLDVVNAPVAGVPDGATWALRGFTSNVRYAERHEIDRLRARQEGLGRAQARCAALIPIRKTPRWWALSQDERRAVFEAQSRHIGIGLDYLPEIARQLHHSRDLGEPFHFLTWFEFAPEHEARFDALLAELRATPEWDYVEREVDIRLVRNGDA